jgi:hypothetical protein
MVTKQSLMLLFALSFAFFILVPPFLDQPLPAYQLMHWADVLDVFTPLVLIPIYWLLFTDSGRIPRTLPLVLGFLVLAVLWTAGQAMHLSANSINNLLGGGSSDVHNLVHFYDEILSHYLWHIAMVGLSILLVTVPANGESSPMVTHWALIIPSAILYGFTYFAAVNEGGTVPFGLTSAILIPIALLLTKRGDLGARSLTTFFFLAYILSTLLFAAWFAYWGGFPEFSDTGII